MNLKEDENKVNIYVYFLGGKKKGKYILTNIFTTIEVGNFHINAYFFSRAFYLNYNYIFLK